MRINFTLWTKDNNIMEMIDFYEVLSVSSSSEKSYIIIFKDERPLKHYKLRENETISVYEEEK